MNKLITLIFIAFSSSVFAGNYPIIDSIKVVYRSDGADYYITQKIIDVGNASEQIINSGQKVALVHKHTFDGVNFQANAANERYVYGINTSIGERAMYVYNNWGKSTNHIVHYGKNGFAECVAYAAYAASQSWDTAIIPGGCMVIPPSNEWCKITTPEILLDHGTITLKQAEGDMSTSSVGVQCTNAVAVKFNLITNDKYIYLDDGKTQISVDDQPLGAKIDLPQGDSQMPVKDLLTGVTKEGFHTGSSVLVMMPY